MYDAIKQLAKEHKIKVKHLLALSSGNDPFYVGSSTDVKLAEWFEQIYLKMGSPINVHLRRIHFWIVSQPEYRKPNGTVYQNTKEDWRFLQKASKYARYLNRVPCHYFVDRRNPEPIRNMFNWSNTTPSKRVQELDRYEIIENIIEGFGDCWHKDNAIPWHLEIWCEKTTMDDIILPIGREYYVNVVRGMGELSITAVYKMIQRVVSIDKPVRIFYISDFDPAGECMPLSVSRKIEYFAGQVKLPNIKLIQIGLTPEQCAEYELPRTPIKETEKRKQQFEERFGVDATELDALEALHPGELKRILEHELNQYVDKYMLYKIYKQNEQVSDKVREYLEDNMEDLLSNLDVSEFDDWEPPRCKEVDDSKKDWLFDSERDYSTQLKKYKDWKQRTLFKQEG